MRDGREVQSERYFECTDSERAAFEAGIKLGTIYHQYVGTPVSEENVETLERAIEAGSLVQPFVERAKVRIDRSKLRRKEGQFDYMSLVGEMLDVAIRIDYKGSKVDAGMRFVEEMDYPLMFVKRVEQGRD